MGKKAKLYFIVLINLLAWGYVGYKVYGALQGDDDVTLSGPSTPIKQISDAAAEDKLSLNLNYPDPFLKGGNFSNARSNGSGSRPSGASSNTASSKPRNNAPSKPTPTLAVAPALNIKYLGLLKNNDKGTQTAMLNVNDRSVFAKQNDVIEGYTVIEIGKDAIKIKKGKEIMTIGK
jgi:hypothetical protein